MKDLNAQKQNFISEIMEALRLAGPDAVALQTRNLLYNLFNLANFAEARNVLVYLPYYGGFDYNLIMHNLFELNKSMCFADCEDPKSLKLYRVDSPGQFLPGTKYNLPRPDASACKQLHFSDIDIIVVNGIAFDGRGNRLSTGLGLYDKLIVALEPTVRKIGLACESQVKSALPSDNKGKSVDILVTDSRVIYKI